MLQICLSPTLVGRHKISLSGCEPSQTVNNKHVYSFCQIDGKHIELENVPTSTQHKNCDPKRPFLNLIYYNIIT